MARIRASLCGSALTSLPQPHGEIPLLAVLLHGGIVRQNISQGQSAAVIGVAFQRFLQGERRSFPPGMPQMHPQLICYPLPEASRLNIVRDSSSS